MAAINITMPLFMTAMGVGLMFGIGASVIASIHLSKNHIEQANIYLTQSLTVSTLLVAFLPLLIMAFEDPIISFLGASEKLIPLVMEYMHVIFPFVFLQTFLITGQFIIRLDGSPNYAMTCNVVPAIINFILDYIFIFIFGWGLSGAAFASVIGMLAGVVLFLLYMLKYSNILQFKLGRLSLSNLRKIPKNIGNTAKIGFPAFLGELAMSSMFLVGNKVFVRALGEDGVAAFSVVCYLFPFVFMITTAIVQSAQPIVSFSHGNGEYRRKIKTLWLSLFVAAIFSGCISIFFITFSSKIVSLFLADTTNAYGIAVEGMPFFAVGFIFFALNMVMIGYYQSIEYAGPATIFTVLRGFVFMISCFIVLPILLKIEGIWLAVPLSELLTLLMIFLFYIGTRKKNYSTPDVRYLNRERTI